MIHVFLADDHTLFREGLRRILEEEADIQVVGTSSDGASVLKASRKNHWDVLVLDLSLPDQPGIDVLKALKQSHPDLPVLILSMHPEDQYALRLIRSGASGYVTKDSAPENLITAIRKLSNGQRYVSDILMDRVMQSIQDGTGEAPQDVLTDREFQILIQIAKGRALSEIASHLKISPKTVSTHRGNIFKKLQFSSRADLVRYAADNKLIDDLGDEY